MASTSSLPDEECVDSIVDSVTKLIKPMFDTVPPLTSDYSIYKVPERLRSVKPEAYTPIVLSIGPFHHGDDRFKTMEHLKTLYLYFLLDQHPETSLKQYVEVLLELETRARNCYAETISYTKEEFVKMLLLDGCFLVELFRKYDDPSLRQQNDQLFKNHWIFNAVHRDVLLLENQIPFFVLEALFQFPRYRPPYLSISGLAKIFLGRYKTTTRYYLSSDDYKEEHLLLSVLKNIVGPITATTQMEASPQNQNAVTQNIHVTESGIGIVTQNPTVLPLLQSTGLTFIPSATELSRVGIAFADSKSSNLFDVRFQENGVLYTPSLIVDDRTESFFRNLIALEQTHSKTTITKGQSQSRINTSPKISAFVTLMDCLVNTSADVALLRDQGILLNQLGDDEEVAQLFNKLRTGLIMNSDEFYFSEVFMRVNVYYHTKWNQLKALFLREFWSTPWAKISMVAATILLICTVVQTISSIL